MMESMTGFWVAQQRLIELCRIINTEARVGSKTDSGRSACDRFMSNGNDIGNKGHMATSLKDLANNKGTNTKATVVVGVVPKAFH